MSQSPRQFSSSMVAFIRASIRSMFGSGFTRAPLNQPDVAAVVPTEPTKPVVIPKSSKPHREWLWRDTTVKAHTKSEARAGFKRMFNLKRLPIGARVMEIRKGK